MSQLSDINKWFVSHVVKHNISLNDAVDAYKDLVSIVTYDDDNVDNHFGTVTNILDNADYMLTQKDGLYGVSHIQIRDWVTKNIAHLV